MQTVAGVGSEAVTVLHKTGYIVHENYLVDE